LLAYCVHSCSHSEVVAPVQLDRVEFFNPSHTIGLTRKSMSWSHREIQEHHLYLLKDTMVYSAQYNHVFHKNELILVSQTYSAHWFDLVGTLGLYTPTKWWKLKKFWVIFIIFEVYAKGNTAQLGFEPSLSNTPVLLVWPENHLGVV